MVESNLKAVLDADVSTVWNIVTSLDDYSWRHDIIKIEVVEAGKTFVEYTKDNYATDFIITKFEPCVRYEFDIENTNIKGHWLGLFEEKNGQTHVDFTEFVEVKKPLKNLFIKGYLKKQQELYLKDLKNKICENNS